MKQIVLASILILSVLTLSAQEKMSRKEKKAARKAEQLAQTKVLIESNNWQFDASQMLPSQGKSRNLTTSYRVVVKNDQVDSYLPYMGRAYRAEYGSTDSPMTFKAEIKDFTVEDWKKGGWIIKFSAKNKADNLDFTFTISDTGSATLSVNSTDRQNISYYGDIVNITDLKAKE
jgi:hypothetical protein